MAHDFFKRYARHFRKPNLLIRQLHQRTVVKAYVEQSGSYTVGGTAHEKILGVPYKYQRLLKK